MYTQAPATKMLNTHCAACGRPLLDAASVTAGLGPVCRKGAETGLDPDTRERANQIINRVARQDVAPEEISAAVVELALLGCDKLAALVSKRAPKLRIEVDEDAGLVRVTAPYSPKFLAARGHGRWNRERKVTEYGLAHAGEATTAIMAAWGQDALVFVTLNGAELNFMRASEARTHLAKIEKAAMAEACEREVVTAGEAECRPATPCPGPQWEGTPTRFMAGWGVKIARAQVMGAGRAPKMGDLVRVTTRAGKTWTARLTSDGLAKSWGYVAATGRL